MMGSPEQRISFCLTQAVKYLSCIANPHLSFHCRNSVFIVYNNGSNEAGPVLVFLWEKSKMSQKRVFDIAIIVRLVSYSQNVTT